VERAQGRVVKKRTTGNVPAGKKVIKEGEQRSQRAGPLLEGKKQSLYKPLGGMKAQGT